jgi:hypothetical protein
MKAVKIALAGQAYYLLFNGAAMFDFEDAFGGSNAYLEAAKGTDRKAAETVTAATAILAVQGELARRDLGYDKGPIPTPEEILRLSSPMDLIRLRQANLAAILAGYEREVESDEPTDLTLLELEQKRGKD